MNALHLLLTLMMLALVGTTEAKQVKQIAEVVEAIPPHTIPSLLGAALCGMVLVLSTVVVLVLWGFIYVVRVLRGRLLV